MPPAKRPVATRAQAPPRHVEQEEQEDDSGSEELDAAVLDMSSDEDAGALPSGSDSEADADADADDEGEEGEGDEELREALFDYQTTAARLREEEEAGAAGDGAGTAGTSAGDGDDEGWVALQPKAVLTMAMASRLMHSMRMHLCREEGDGHVDPGSDSSEDERPNRNTGAETTLAMCFPVLHVFAQHSMVPAQQHL